jgi:hypothetical protein
LLYLDVINVIYLVPKKAVKKKKTKKKTCAKTRSNYFNNES